VSSSDSVRVSKLDAVGVAFARDHELGDPTPRDPSAGVFRTIAAYVNVHDWTPKTAEVNTSWLFLHQHRVRLALDAVAGRA
jgi:hypothetical protein